MVIIEQDCELSELRNKCVNEFRPFLFQDTEVFVSQLFSDLESKPWKKSAAATIALAAEPPPNAPFPAESDKTDRTDEAALDKKSDGGFCLCDKPCLPGQCHTRDTNAQLLPAHVRLVKHVCHSSCHGKIGLDRVV